MIFIFVRRKNLLAGLIIVIFLFLAGNISLFADEIRESRSTEQSQDIQVSQQTQEDSVKEELKTTIERKEQETQVEVLKRAQLVSGENAEEEKKEKAVDIIDGKDLYKIVEMRYRQGKEYFELKEYLKAKEEFIEVLRLVPKHSAAIRYMDSCDKEIEKIERKKAEIKRRKEARTAAKRVRLGKRQNKQKAEEGIAENRAKKREERRRKIKELRVAREQPEPIAMSQKKKFVKKKREKTTAKPTLGDKVLEEEDKHREAEANLLLLTEKKIRFFREMINDFLEEQYNKKDAERLYKIGVKFFEQKKYGLARAEFEKAVSVYPEHKKSKSYIRKIDKIIDKIKRKFELR